MPEVLRHPLEQVAVRREWQDFESAHETRAAVSHVRP